MNKHKEKLIISAIKSFGGTGKFFGVFNTAGYQSAMKKIFDYMPSGKIVKQHLENHSRILKLYGGSHWKYN